MTTTYGTKPDQIAALELGLSVNATPTQIAAARQALGTVSAALVFTLDTLCDMTSDQFAKGGDREIRKRLAEALGRDAADYIL